VLISKIYALFLGTFVGKDKSKNQPKPEHRRIAANTRIRLKLMPHLLKSREAALQVGQVPRRCRPVQPKMFLKATTMFQ
jgi:hypothetical protein